MRSRIRLIVVLCVAALGASGMIATGGFVAAGGLTNASTSTARVNSGVAAQSSSYLFDDEFDGTSLDLSKWRPNWLGGSNTTITKPINGAELSCYDPAQVRLPGDGSLHLAAAHRSCTASNGTTYAYASGLVETFGHFTFTEGTLEARVWLPGTTTINNWPAVWTDGTGSWPATGESDIMEGLSGKACYHYHSPSGGPGGCASGAFTGWHTFGEVVHGGTATYYYDGAKVGSESTVVAPHYIILNLGVGGYGGTIAAPSEMLVDYVRVTPVGAPPSTTTTAARPTTTTTTTVRPATTTTTEPSTAPSTAPPTSPPPTTPPQPGGGKPGGGTAPGHGYWTVSAAGQVHAYGRAHTRGDLTGRLLAAPIVAAARTATGNGYWLAGGDGNVYAFGDAHSYGSMARRHLAAPIVGMSATRTGRGYYLLGADGGIFTFGDARFHGSTGNMRLAAPVLDIALSPSGNGYWLVARDGGVFTFGDARFRGSAGALHLASPIASIAAGQHGYWLVAGDGGIFAFGVPFRGSVPGLGATGVTDAKRIRAFPDDSGYYILTGHGSLFTFGRAPYYGADAPSRPATPVVDLVLATG
ncbi:MAG: hypothetical protein JWL83_3016 [Actinomycetia bacterium]|nr:hypothetical protein [Actinomycetes bacterium]